MENDEKNCSPLSQIAKINLDPDSYSIVYDILDKYYQSKNSKYKFMIDTMCYEKKEDEFFDRYLTSELQRMSLILSDPKWFDDCMYPDRDRSDLKNVITFYKDILTFRDYFAAKGIEVSSNEIFNLFVDIRDNHRSKFFKSRIDAIFEAIEPKIIDSKSLHEIIKEYAIHYFTDNKYDEQGERSLITYSIWILPALLSKFGFEYRQDQSTTELRNLLKDVLREIRLEAFDRNIESSYEKTSSFFNDTKLIQNTSRDSISSVTKMEVWRRDEGRCVKCGSRYNLEYDHIIPVSKGGSNTSRNIELLCQDCNRKKSDKIM